MPKRSPASHLVKGSSGEAFVSVYAQDGHVVVPFGPFTLKLRPDEARWLSGELAVKAALLDGVVDPLPLTGRVA